jgi:hypothetical protein
VAGFRAGDRQCRVGSGAAASQALAKSSTWTHVGHGAFGAKAMVRETVFPYSGAEAGGAFAQRTFAYLRSHQVPAGKTTSREPLRNSSLGGEEEGDVSRDARCASEWSRPA